MLINYNDPVIQSSTPVNHNPKSNFSNHFNKINTQPLSSIYFLLTVYSQNIIEVHMDIIDKIDLFLGNKMSNQPHLYSIDFYLGSNDTNVYSSLNTYLSKIGVILFDEITSNRFIRSRKSLNEIKNLLENEWDDRDKSFKFILIDLTDKDVDFIGIDDEEFKTLLKKLLTGRLSN